ncbi:LysR family transcriptional regulator [Microvirga arabica]|uniref:LysR family transcriptional regulator n=1 Tax=Microvirga arabica TaxID=1128671 RepID=A0ABV6YG21_9HYPH
MNTLDSMRVYVRVVEFGSFAAAARNLDLSPAMVTKHVAHLEKRIGALLLHRTTRQVRPTEVGQAYFERCLALLSDFEAAESEASAGVTTPRGPLRVTAPNEFSPYLGQMTAEFLRLYPEVDLTFDFSNRFVNIVEEGYDVAIRISASLDSSLVGRRIALSRAHIVASPRYIEQHGRPESPEMLADHPCLSYGMPSPSDEWIFQKDNETKKIRIRNKLVSTRAEPLILAARAGAGVSWLPTFVCGQDLREGRLVSLFPDHHVGSLEVYILHPHRRFVPTKVKAFINVLTTSLNPGEVDDPWE